MITRMLALMLAMAFVQPRPETALAEQAAEARAANLKAEVSAVVTKRFDAAQAQSVDQIADLYLQSDDLVIFREGRIIRGWTAYSTYWRNALSHLPKGFGVKFSNVRVSATKEQGWAAAEWTTTYTDDGKGQVINNGLITLILAKTPQGWRIVHEHISDAK